MSATNTALALMKGVLPKHCRHCNALMAMTVVSPFNTEYRHNNGAGVPEEDCGMSWQSPIISEGTPTCVQAADLHRELTKALQQRKGLDKDMDGMMLITADLRKHIDDLKATIVHLETELAQSMDRYGEARAEVNKQVDASKHDIDAAISYGFDGGYHAAMKDIMREQVSYQAVQLGVPVDTELRDRLIGFDYEIDVVNRFLDLYFSSADNPSYDENYADWAAEAKA